MEFVPEASSAGRAVFANAIVFRIKSVKYTNLNVQSSQMVDRM